LLRLDRLWEEIQLAQRVYRHLYLSLEHVHQPHKPQQQVKLQPERQRQRPTSELNRAALAEALLPLKEVQLTQRVYRHPYISLEHVHQQYKPQQQAKLRPQRHRQQQALELNRGALAEA